MALFALIFSDEHFLPHGNKVLGAPFPAFPVKSVGVDELDAAFLNESRTRCRCLVPRTGNSGQAVFGLEWDRPGGNQESVYTRIKV
jgi:hypothetical protein